LLHSVEGVWTAFIRKMGEMLDEVIMAKMKKIMSLLWRDMSLSLVVGMLH